MEVTKCIFVINPTLDWLKTNYTCAQSISLRMLLLTWK